MHKTKLNFVFFGTSEEAVYALESLNKKGYIPKLIVTTPDRPVGRKQLLTPPLAKKWALDHSIPVFQPEKIDQNSIKKIKEERADIFIVVGYGKILPKDLIDISAHKALNIHTSLLPLYRGPTPVQGPILSGDDQTGVTIIVVDPEMDHGPIVAQEKYVLKGHEMEPELTKTLFTRGGELLAEILPDWIDGKIIPKEQNHTEATFTKKLKKEDGEIDLSDDPVKNYNKFRAYAAWPRTFFFKDGKRIIITKARLEDGKFIIERIIPEGGKEIKYPSISR